MRRAADFLDLQNLIGSEPQALGFMARALVQATLPHRQPAATSFERHNGAYTLTMVGLPKIGLPYGTVPRLVLCWLATEAVRKRSPHIVLGDSLSSFMRELGMVPTGGRWGSIPRLRNQCRRLFTTTVSCSYDGPAATAEEGFRLASKHVLWWDTNSPEQREIFPSFVDLSAEFYREIVEHPVPIDVNTLKAVSRSPLAIDIYCWTTFRMSYLRRPTLISWSSLEAQFGAEYHRPRDFRAAFLEHLGKVSRYYTAARLEPKDAGLFISPSATHVLRKPCG